MNKLPVLLSFDGLNRFFANIDSNVEKNNYNFKNLVNIYFDYSFIVKYNDKILKLLFKELK